MSPIDSFVVDINDVFWTYLLIPLVIGAGLYFTVRSKAVQLRLFPEMLRVLKGRPQPGEDGGKAVSSFGAFTISAAARVGTGNIAGVATAITLGGAGAVFWMWVMAVIGGASAFVESALAQLYKVRGAGGTYRGGPAYYMQRALGKRWLGVLFAVTITVTFGFVFNAVQSNTITSVATASLPASEAEWFGPAIGLLLAALLGLAVFGGVKRISSVTTVLVPVMAVVYLLLGSAVVLLNLGDLPRVFGDIVGGAFGFRELAAGGIGAAIQQGIRRGMFSNEAGLGSAPNAGATAEVSHPVKQGLVQSLGVFFDTLLICSMTAFIILTTNPGLGGRQGADLTQSALTDTLGGWAGHVLTLVVFMLAFSSMIGNYYYGQSNIEFMTARRWVLPAYRALVLVVVFLGALGSVSVVWNLADVFMGLMALVNLLAILPLSAIAFRLLDDYVAQRRLGLDPVFTRDRLPDLVGVECWEARPERAAEKTPV
ncbi:alanine/glycine:cation symporter family protein [Streptomyces morookaense]|uniref:Alanine:cation symporter family protein n=1 Tax=Streptomyces morookaense TaxID=1970 RepID=A0A7Y7B4Q4_STRMO|nr:alanine/glycine:cation symporter family protein [Streptomyces morookaense]NVK78820.1 alanine:cation symporter family protein [Streptomyces morookaense]GHF35031.1 sodium:alanine symporter [Streptomyces morookaense]